VNRVAQLLIIGSLYEILDGNRVEIHSICHCREVTCLNGVRRQQAIRMSKDFTSVFN